MRVTDAAGTTRTLRVATAAYFPEGPWFARQVDPYVRTLAVCRQPVPDRGSGAGARRDPPHSMPRGRVGAARPPSVADLRLAHRSCDTRPCFARSP